MLYHLALYLLPEFGALNVLTYHTVRAGGAAFTAFMLCVLSGPWAIRMLKSLKIGQYIRKDHVTELHELHKGKSGTPTMGGAMFIVSAVVALLLWSTLQNRLMWLAVAVFLMLGAVGFLDDYTKMKRKENAGLTARAKMLGQIISGLALGLFLYFYPVAYSAGHIDTADVNDWPAFLREIASGADEPADTPKGRLWSLVPAEQQQALRTFRDTGIHEMENEVEMRRDLRDMLRSPQLSAAEVWVNTALGDEAKSLMARDNRLSDLERVRLNRLLCEAAFPSLLMASTPDRHTAVGLPGFKDVFVPLGILYVAFVVFLIVGTSNAVNLTDGLDGLAAGTAIISITAFSAIAYVVSRADWSSYLFITYVPEASELFVFGAALLGAGLGFLWFNAHPAEVFMGDTGSLALGGAIATMAILIKQELLLPLVAGLFMIEASSVIIQVLYYKATGRRFFRMSPLHHHFELLGWSETKVTMRFWIVAFLLAMMSLATLKLR